MEINSSNYLTRASLQSMQVNYPSQNMQVAAQQNHTSDKDSYVSSISDTEASIPSESYSDIMELIKANKQANGESEGAPTESDFAQALAQYEASSDEEDSTVTVTDTTDTTTNDSTTSTDSAESSSGTSSDSSSDDSTATEILVGRDGSTYLKTTTTAEDGTETITVTKISDGAESDSSQIEGQPDMQQGSEMMQMQQMQQGPEMMQMNTMNMQMNSMESQLDNMQSSQMQSQMGNMGNMQLNNMHMFGMQNTGMGQMPPMMPPTDEIDDATLEALTSNTENEVETA